ncbi:MAG: OmpA family protein [Candidatus Cloacimonetes bacterium]|nr:OmpA family protein [Candidatus Cloacimonadota bacterium]
MAGILIVFILLFIFETINVNKKLREKEEIIEELSSIRNKIIAKLKNEFDKENMKIEIDPETGAIKLNDKILFNSNKHEIKTEGKEFLDNFIPKYVNLLLGDEEIAKNISNIIIEGHTDDIGSYIYNLNLSQKRAFAVVDYIFREMSEFEEKERLKNFITANGRSKVKLIKDKVGNVNREESRRVEFLFKLQDDKTIKRMQKILRDEDEINGL